MLRRRLLGLLMLAALGGLSSCQPAPETASPEGRGVSTLPWNRPASWEGGGMVGSQLSSMRGY